MYMLSWTTPSEVDAARLAVPSSLFLASSSCVSLDLYLTRSLHEKTINSILGILNA